MRSLLLAALLTLPSAPAFARAGGGGGGGGGGGCFPAGTIIATAAGKTAIEDIRPGIKVLAFTGDRVVQAEVKDFIKKKDRLRIIRTSKGKLTATLEHPLLTRYGFTEVRDLKTGDEVAMLTEGRRVWAKIRSIKPGGVAEVYNLEVAPPHTFIADGFIVHNKGGGSFGGGSYSRGYYSGGRYYSRGRSSGDNLIFALAATFLLIRGFLFISERKSAFSGGSGPCKSTLLENGLVTPKAEATLDILKSLGRADPAFNPDQLEGFVRSVFTRVQIAWQARDYRTLSDVMMPHLHAGHSAKVASMKERGEINMMEDLTILHVDFVNVRCPREKEGRAFTSLITASARDYTINERTNYGRGGGLVPASNLELRSGSHEPTVFQEFWTFNQWNGNWALARIDQLGELDFLNAPNLPDSPQGAGIFPQAAAGDADQPAPAFGNAAAGAAPYYQPAPPLPAAAARDGRCWDRQKMETAATLAFESVYWAWGKNDSSLLKAEFVSAEALARLKRLMEARKSEGLSFSFESLFARRAEIVLTSPAAKSKLRLDEFTARITATAVRSMLRNGKPLHRDAAPEPFTEYWVFGRQKDDWKMRDILPRMEQESADTTQDGAPTPVQIEWYWAS